ncbi:2-keto-4-pentenoate hydratase [Caenimonas sedimenti]|uniref:2-keto-4-pentenoate hydratase n=1 Tax=Caenimonas sedimenti TaxID=2596921 RepID=A0A562ZQL6_9BURK|nr:fumarylacetoacetate hydrolase family protein [Caenimonas sedimenti]TWO70889.1 2-keto-4-pentenoate hydratase [Caenimonas sedimenti]
MNGTEQVTAALLRARRERQPVSAASLGDLLPDARAAYAVQSAVAAQGRLDAHRHWKSGGPTLATVTHAALPAAGVRISPADLRDLHFNWRGIEAEIALRLARDIGHAEAEMLGDDAAASLIDAMAVSIEVVDSRWAEGRQAPALFKLADLQSHGALVLGAWVPYAGRDWARQTCVVRIGAAPAQSFQGSHALVDPGSHLASWLRHATRDGTVVPAGTVVTTGTWCGLLMAQPGDLVHAVFEGIGEASAQF